MAYSKNIRDIVVRLRKEGHSAEEIVDILDLLTEKKSRKIPNALRQIADDASTHFGVADWNQLKGSLPTAKTIRRWDGESKVISKQTNKVNKTKHQKKPLSRKKKNHVEVSAQNESPVQKPPIVVTTDPQSQEIVPRDELKPKNETDNTDVTSESPDASSKVVSLPQQDDSHIEIPFKYLNEDNLNKLFTGGPCSAPPDDIDVVILKSWGIPRNKTAVVLQEWISWHRQGRHDICLSFPVLKEDISKRKIPFDQAFALLEIEIKAIEFHLDIAHQEVELARKLRPWESKENNQAFFREYHELTKPSQARKKHLEEVTQLLMLWLYELETVLSNQTVVKRFEVEAKPLFSFLLTHCHETEYIYGDLEHLRFDKRAVGLDSKKLKTITERETKIYKTLRKTINQSLKEQNYYHTYCSSCPE